MLSININGVTIEAESAKDLHKLIKKEEKRQAEKKAKKDKAGVLAWASYGHLAHAVSEKHPQLWFIEPSVRQVGTYDAMVKIESRTEPYGELMVGYGYSITITIMSIAGDTLAIRSLSSEVIVGTEEICWLATGAYQGEAEYHWIAQDVADKLEIAYQAFLRKKSAGESNENL